MTVGYGEPYTGTQVETPETAKGEPKVLCRGHAEMAEAVEGRWQPKENDAQSNTPPTQRGTRVSQGLSGVRRAAGERRQERFTALLHHVTVNLLRESFDAFVSAGVKIPISPE